MKYVLIHLSHILYEEVVITDYTYVHITQGRNDRVSLTFFPATAMKFDTPDEAIKWRDKNIDKKIWHKFGAILL